MTVFFFLNRAEGSSKVQSRIEQQQQQIRNSTKTPNNIKNSPPKDKMFPSSPMDDIERGKLHCLETLLLTKIFLKAERVLVWDWLQKSDLASTLPPCFGSSGSKAVFET